MMKNRMNTEATFSYQKQGWRKDALQEIRLFFFSLLSSFYIKLMGTVEYDSGKTKET